MLTEPRWAVIIAAPAAEEIAEREVRVAGYRVYLPRYRRFLRAHRSSGRGEIVLRPAMFGYLFAELHPSDDQYARRIIDCRGVRDFLRLGNDLATVSEAAVETIRADERAGKFDEPRCRRGKEVSRPDLEIGEKVRIEIGGIGFVATLEKLDKSDRAIVRYMIFGRQVRSEVDAMSLEVA